MIGYIQVRERGATPGIAKREFNNLSKAAWFDAAANHHRDNTRKRFTEAHARAAGYVKRKGEGLDRNSKAFRRSYYGRKLRSEKGGGKGQALPLVFSGRSRDRAKFPKVASTFRSAKLKFNTPAFNFRHPKSRIRMSEEFRRVLPKEQQAIARTYDDGLDRRLNAIQSTKQTTLR